MRARLDALEQELEDARAENDALRSRDQTPGGPGAWFLGAATILREERSLDGEVPDSAHEDMVEALRARFEALGQVSHVGQSLAWTLAPPASTRIVEASVARRGGRTVIRVTERLGNLAGGLFGGIVGGAGGGGLGFVIPLAFLLRVPALIPFLAVGWLASVYAIVRATYTGIARRRASELRAAADELLAIAEATAEMGPRVRVGTESDPVEARTDAPRPRRHRDRDD